MERGDTSAGTVRTPSTDTRDRPVPGAGAGAGGGRAGEAGRDLGTEDGGGRGPGLEGGDIEVYISQSLKESCIRLSFS